MNLHDNRVLQISMDTKSNFCMISNESKLKDHPRVYNISLFKLPL